MTKTLALVWALVAAIHPGAAHTGQVGTVAPAIAYVVDADPLPDTWDKPQAAAALVSMAWNESRFGANPVGPARCDSHGDCHAYGVWQAEHRPWLVKDVVGAARFAYSMLRVGVRDCPEAPLAPMIGGCYFAGTKKPNWTARAISDKRLTEAGRILDEAEGNETQENF
jgi:hypothetical protein